MDGKAIKKVISVPRKMMNFISAKILIRRALLPQPWHCPRSNPLSRRLGS